MVSSDLAKKDEHLFRKEKPWKALLTMAVPTILSQLILVIYNLADTWYIGLTGNPAMVAAMSLTLPIYTILTSISNLCGIGGASHLSKALGQNDLHKAGRIFALSLWLSFLFSLVYSIVILIFGRSLLYGIGADAGDIEYSWQFTLIAIVIGGLPTILSASFSQLIRATGNPGKASLGMILGALSSIVLDPLFMFVILPSGHEVLGASIATALANCISLLYYIFFMIRHQQDHVYQVLPKGNLQENLHLSKDILITGLPSCAMLLLAQISNCILNGMLDTISTEAVAGMGLVRKVDQMAYAINQGITQGMLPLVAYCFGAGLQKREHHILVLAAVWSEIIACTAMLISQLCPEFLMGLFINNPQTIQYGASFLRIISLTVPVYSLTFVLIAYFQAVGKNGAAFLLSVLHKGSIDIVLFYVFKDLFGIGSILWANMAAESAALIVGLLFLFAYSHKTTNHKSFHHMQKAAAQA